MVTCHSAFHGVQWDNVVVAAYEGHTKTHKSLDHSTPSEARKRGSGGRIPQEVRLGGSGGLLPGKRVQTKAIEFCNLLLT
jgi:hypothetical protein